MTVLTPPPTLPTAFTATTAARVPQGDNQRPAPLASSSSLDANAKVAIVDDEPVNIKVTKKFLHTAGFREFVTTSDAKQAFEFLRKERPDIVLLDIVMPEVSGMDILERLQLDPLTSTTPVLILTASTEHEIKVRALELGATDFLAKPVDPNELLPRVRNALLVKAHRDHLARYAEQLEAEVRQRTEELALSRREIIECLARAADYRDESTGHHIVRVGKYAAELSRAVGLPEDEIELIEQAAQLHDVGKIGIPDVILRKPGKLDPEEFAFMKRHCAFGQKILQRMSDREFTEMQTALNHRAQVIQARSSRLVELAATIAISHHEWWNGCGYPNGLKETEIPLPGRITAIADVYDALSSPRPYKSAYSHEACVAMIKEGRGTQFDPTLVDKFRLIVERFDEIRRHYADR